MRLVVVAVDVYVETSVGRRCAGAPGRSSLFGPQERTRKTHGGPSGLLWHARRVGGNRKSRDWLRPSRLPIRVHTSNPRWNQRERTQRENIGGSHVSLHGRDGTELDLFAESTCCRYIRGKKLHCFGAGDLGIARRELQHTAEGRGLRAAIIARPVRQPQLRCSCLGRLPMMAVRRTPTLGKPQRSAVFFPANVPTTS